MLEAICPQCGAPLVFRSAGLPIIVCDYCRSTVMRTGDALSKTGSSAGVPEAASPLQLGVTGVDGDAPFTLVGRVRWLWGATPENGQVARGSWTEWLMLYGDSSFGWLAEAGGRLMISRRHTISANNKLLGHFTAGGAMRPGMDCEIDGTRFRVTDARPAVSAGCDGEIPFAAPPGETIFSVDLVSRDGRFAAFQRHGETVETYLGRTVTLQQLQPRGLRALPGWTPPDWATAAA